jgi:hypothetical protein
MNTPTATARFSTVLRWSVGLGAFVCILGAVVLLLRNGVLFIRREALGANIQMNLAQMAVGMHNYASSHDGAPQADVLGKDGRPLLSWRVLLLPYVEEHNLYSDFKLDEPWDSPHNSKLISRMPLIYKGCRDCSSPPHTTYYQVIRGPGTPLERPELKFEDFKGDAANTFLIVEAAEPVIWSKPDDLQYLPDGQLPKLGGIIRNGFFRVVMVNGKPRKLSLSDEAAIRAGITGKEP